MVAVVKRSMLEEELEAHASPFMFDVLKLVPKMERMAGFHLQAPPIYSVHLAPCDLKLFRIECREGLVGIFVDHLQIFREWKVSC